MVERNKGGIGSDILKIGLGLLAGAAIAIGGAMMAETVADG